MYSRHMLPKTGASRVTGTRVFHPLTPPRSILRSQGRPFSSWQDPPPTSSYGRTARYIAFGGVPAAALLYYWRRAGPPPRDRVPHLDAPPTARLAAPLGPSRAQVTDMLLKDAYSVQVRGVPGVVRYDGAGLATSSPRRGRWTHGSFDSPRGDGGRWMAWGLFDGARGWQAAELLSRRLVPFVRHALGQVAVAGDDGTAAIDDGTATFDETAAFDGTMPDSLDEPMSDGRVQRAVRDAFVGLDDAIMGAGLGVGLDADTTEEPLQDKLKRLEPCYTGSCALLSLYDPAARKLHVACAGNSRAVLAQLGPDHRWHASLLSADPADADPEEAARRRAEAHPGEEWLVKNGRVVTPEPPRGFGDGRWKWPMDAQLGLMRRFAGPQPAEPRSASAFRTPPYVTADPVVTSTEIDPGRPSFLIMASDGLWRLLTCERAVELVAAWVEAPPARARADRAAPDPEYAPLVDVKGLAQSLRWDPRRRTTVRDDNAAAHLVRNALGGNHHESVAALLAFDTPLCQFLRRDMAVQVVFFNP